MFFIKRTKAKKIARAKKKAKIKKIAKIVKTILEIVLICIKIYLLFKK
ncbi:TPA: hypothetical protein SOL99_003690 [Clostridioides difficile]|nr:hypothetical protein [Clostridioides difficile]